MSGLPFEHLNNLYGNSNNRVARPRSLIWHCLPYLPPPEHSCTLEMTFNIFRKLLGYFRASTLASRPPTHAEIFAAGNVPPELSIDYSEALDLLDNVVRDCIGVSRQYAGIRAPSGRHFYASVLFTSLISRGISLTILAPHSPWAHKMIEHWDYASAAIITRTMIELRSAFHYLCVDDCCEEEWQCRWNLLCLHELHFS